MSTGILFQQLIVLFAMMAAGFIAFRLHVFDRVGQHQISSLIAKVLNPFILLTSLTGERPENSGILMRQSAVLAAIYYGFMILCSFLYVMLTKPEKKKKNLQQLMLIFSNTAFFAIPLIRGLFGDGYIIFLVFYLLFYSVLCYTLGIYLAVNTGDGEKQKFSFRQFLNPGLLAAVVALCLYLFNIRLTGAAGSICTYFGNCCIPLSMILIGASLAQVDIKKVIATRENWLFTCVKMLLIPFAGIMLSKLLPFNAELKTIFCLELTMPVSTMSGVLAEEYAGKGNEANQVIALTTLVTMITIPLLSLLF